MTQRFFRAIFALSLSLFITTPAFAAWHKAESDRFVIYADDSVKDIQRFSENLERYHKAMEFLTQTRIDPPSPSSRVTIFVAGSQRDIRKLSGAKSRNVAGFYIPRASGSIAFVQDIRNKNGYPHFSTVILLHEYAHHFLISNSRFAMPKWANEGAAEFFSAVGFEKDGGMLIGRPAIHRGAELAYATNVTARQLLERTSTSVRGRGDAFYGRSWLLYHYLNFNKERSGQLNTYLNAVVKGTPSVEAGEAAFGDLDVLEKELKSYSRQRRMMTFVLKPQALPIGEIAITRLSEGEAAMMEVRMRSQRGVNKEQAAELVIDARKIATKYPGDAGVQTALAEAEYDAGNLDAAIAAADKAIAADPARANAYVQKGYALFAKAKDADNKAAAYNKAMKPFSKLNSIENDHPMPLVYYYRSFAERRKAPPENARHALERAAQLAPFDKGLWMQVAVMQMNEEKPELARLSLLPIANDPHGGKISEAAKKIIAGLSDIPAAKGDDETSAAVSDEDGDTDASAPAE